VDRVGERLVLIDQRRRQSTESARSRNERLAFPWVEVEKECLVTFLARAAAR